MKLKCINGNVTELLSSYWNTYKGTFSINKTAQRQDKATQLPFPCGQPFSDNGYFKWKARYVTLRNDNYRYLLTLLDTATNIIMHCFCFISTFFRDARIQLFNIGVVSVSMKNYSYAYIIRPQLLASQPQRHQIIIFIALS